MSSYVPEFLNEVMRMVVTTPNANPSVEEYDKLVLPEWRACQEISTRLEQAKRTPTIDEQVEVARRVIAILRHKRVPESEIHERFTEVFERCEQGGAYPFQRASVVPQLSL